MDVSVRRSVRQSDRRSVRCPSVCPILILNNEKRYFQCSYEYEYAWRGNSAWTKKKEKWNQNVKIFDSKCFNDITENYTLSDGKVVASYVLQRYLFFFWRACQQKLGLFSPHTDFNYLTLLFINFLLLYPPLFLVFPLFASIFLHISSFPLFLSLLSPFLSFDFTHPRPSFCALLPLHYRPE